MQTVGTCSLCGGAVCVPLIFWSIVPPTPACAQCGATPKAAHGPVIDMQHSRSWTIPTVAAARFHARECDCPRKADGMHRTNCGGL